MVYQDSKWHMCKKGLVMRSGKLIKRLYKNRQMTLDNKVLLTGPHDKILLVRTSNKLRDYVIEETGAVPFDYKSVLVYVSTGWLVMGAVFYTECEVFAYGPTHIVALLRTQYNDQLVLS